MVSRVDHDAGDLRLDELELAGQRAELHRHRAHEREVAGVHRRSLPHTGGARQMPGGRFRNDAPRGAWKLARGPGGLTLAA